MAFFQAGKHAGQSFEQIAADDRRYSAWALREQREGAQLSRNLAAFVKYVKKRHGGVVGVGKHRGLYPWGLEQSLPALPCPPSAATLPTRRYFDELLRTDPEYVEWCQSLASPGNALQEIADYAREQEEAGKKRKREGDEGAIKKCMICLERPLAACWIPCGHATTCYECALGVENHRCPICRKRGYIQRLFVG